MRSRTGATRRRRAGRIILRSVKTGLSPYGARIVTVVGRYYAMDRDQRWDRTKLAWDAIVHGKGTPFRYVAIGGGGAAVS